MGFEHVPHMVVGHLQQISTAAVDESKGDAARCVCHGLADVNKTTPWRAKLDVLSRTVERAVVTKEHPGKLVIAVHHHRRCVRDAIVTATRHKLLLLLFAVHDDTLSEFAAAKQQPSVGSVGILLRLRCKPARKGPCNTLGCARGPFHDKLLACDEVFHQVLVDVAVWLPRVVFFAVALPFDEEIKRSAVRTALDDLLDNELEESQSKASVSP
jgi:hypothetical protein